MSPPVIGLSGEFASITATENGVALHYVGGGQRASVVLIHGFPQDWFEYHAIMPRLAKRFTVIGVDLRGVGGSTATRGGYDAAKMAKDVYQLAVTLKLERTYSVGHSIGGMVAYAFVRWLVPKMADGLRANGCTHVETGLIPGGARYVVEDQPEAVAGLIERHASPHSQ